jgi:glycosyltransferase involved in cell wall biosynthesis
MSSSPRLAILLAGVSGDSGVSMRRYARELFVALANRDRRCWQFNLIQPSQQRWVSRIWRHTQAVRIESAVARYALYPAELLRRNGDLFHVLDHAYGHLVRVLDPSKTIVTCHDLIPLLSADGRIPIPMPASVVRTARLRVNEMVRARRILTDSESTRDDLLHYTNAPASKITVIPPGVNSVFEPGEPADVGLLRARLEIPPGVVVILQVATRGRYKNTPALLRALALLRKSLGQHIVLVRIGVPLYDDEAELARRLAVTGGIRNVGVVDDLTLAHWYRAATVLAFPSLWEGFGWPPLEAMASGTPVVASRIPAILEVVHGAAALIDPYDDIDLAAALERVITEPTYAARLRSLGVERSKQLTWDETGRRTLAVYEEVAEGGAARDTADIVLPDRQAPSHQGCGA